MSAARRAFQSRALDLLRSAREGDRVTLPRAHQLALQGAVIQIHAAFEEYVSEFLNDWSYARALARPPAKELPDYLRQWLLHTYLEGRYASFFIRRDEADLLKGLDLSAPVFATIINDATYLKTSAEDILGDRGYPSLANLVKVFRRLGLPNLNAYLGMRLKVSAEAYFANFSTTRTSIAHRTRGPITLSDVRLFAVRARTIVFHLDGAFYDALCVGTGSSVWR